MCRSSEGNRRGGGDHSTLSSHPLIHTVKHKMRIDRRREGHEDKKGRGDAKNGGRISNWEMNMLLVRGRRVITFQ